MTKLARLKREARESAEGRGHRMSRFRREFGYMGSVATAHCLSCGKIVTVVTKPPANGIDIGGEAVALGCAD